MLRDYVFRQKIPLGGSKVGRGGSSLRSCPLETSEWLLPHWPGQWKPDPKAISQRLVLQKSYGEEVDVFTISCTRSKRLLYRRPTEEQPATLVEPLGEERM
ncbi:hypothetical protein BDN70DRAFT_267196 [Pholiota conissans]|uniref:Uncharacterized protein n=1 Tax=Pholiota conissans TaxID=109636 RepID=A0A9P5YUB4_9AGAR|nr:hypothetical protein BDN70DRAFT_267196 [Pholiota conissans]